MVAAWILSSIGIGAALERLLAECESRTHLVQGDPLTDGHFYRFRITLLTGLLSAFALSQRIRGERANEDAILKFLRKNVREARMWGEGSVSYLMMTALFIETATGRGDGENLMASALNAIAAGNKKEDPDCPIPTSRWNKL